MLCFLSFCTLREALDPGNQAKTYKSVQKRRSYLFIKNLDIIKKCTKNSLPRDPQNPAKPRKKQKNMLPKTT